MRNAIANVSAKEKKFFIALSCGRFDLVKKIADQGLNIYNVDKLLLEKLKAKFCDSCNDSHLQILWNIRPNIAKSQDYFSLTLNHACGKGNVRLVKNLYNKYQDSKSKYCHPMIYACKSGSLSLVKYLLSKGEDILEKDQFENCNACLYQACLKGHLALVKFLIKKGAAICADHEKIINSSCRSGNVKLVDYLINTGIGVNQLDFESMKESCHSGSIKMVHYLLDKGIELYKDEKDALYYACWSGNLKLVEYLDQHGANYYKNSAMNLAFACYGGNLKILEYLVKKGLSISLQGGDALIAASSEGHISMVKYLVNHEVDIHFKSDEAVKRAVMSSHFNIAQYLLGRGSKIYFTNSKLDDFFRSTIFSHANGIKFLISSGLRGYNEEILMRACDYCDDLNIVKYLFDIYKPSTQAIYSVIVNLTSSDFKLEILKFVFNRLQDTLISQETLINAARGALSYKAFKIFEFLWPKIYDKNSLNACYHSGLLLCRKGELSFPSPCYRHLYSMEVFLFLFEKGIPSNLRRIEIIRIIAKMDDLNKLDKIINQLNLGRKRIINEGFLQLVSLSRYITLLNNLKYFIKRGADVNANKGAALQNVCSIGNYKVAKYLISQGADTSINSAENIKSAAKFGYLKIFKLLHHHKVDIHCFDQSPLKIAIDSQQVNIVEYLLKYGADIHIDQEYPLRAACKLGNYPIVKFLISYGANLSISTPEIITEAATIGGNIYIVQLLSENGVNFNDNIFDLLNIAINYNHIELFNYYLRCIKDVNPNYTDFILVACKFSSLEILQTLMQKGISKERIQFDAFQQSLLDKNFSFADKLIQFGFDINKFRHDLFKSAWRFNDEEILNYLFKRCNNSL